ncbi:mitochondrial inner membrane protein OXA1-like [Diospyros lotus]|uniref:mitochondrial inner membrane protein OXA1-like n=1 Tax=Diospyros lotus TaxID=55363 RepID=UPI00225155B6|nr:mitochondrial inner membrane protein OXA1-like [Diospyros lotus]
MAYRRSLCTRATLLARHRFAPSFSHIHRDDDRNKQSEDRKIESLLQNRSFGASCRGLRPSQFLVSPMAGSFFSRNMSTTVGEGADKVEYMTDMAEVLADRTVEAVVAAAATATPAVNEVAIAAADSAFPVAALQYLIDGVHSFTGFNWWASIVVTTLLIRGATVPLLINQLKSTSKLTILRPHLVKIKEEMQDSGMDPKAVADGQQRMQALFKEYGVHPLTPLKGLLFQGPVFVSFFLAISNMVEKVPSFKHGGVYWFTDLTTPDSLYIFPALAALTFWITVECNMQEGMEGNPAAKTMKNVSRVFAALTVPITMTFPKALFCYWVTSNVFSLMYGLVLKAPGVKKFLGVPVIPAAPPSKTAEKPFSFLEAVKKYAAAQAAQQVNSSRLQAAPKPAADHRIPSSAVLSQRIKSLEKKVKGRKNNKKR